MKNLTLKYVEEIEQAFTAMLKGFGISEVKLSTMYAYIFVTESIVFKPTHDITDKWFDEFVATRFKLKTCNTMVISLLHEVGHHLANDGIVDDIEEFCEKEKSRIHRAMAKAKKEETAKRLEFEYFNLPDEIMATQWAINYAKSHPKEIEKMNKVTDKYMKKFYKANKVEGRWDSYDN